MTKYADKTLKSLLKMPSIMSKVQQATALIRQEFMQLGAASERDGDKFWEGWTALPQLFTEPFWKPALPFVERLVLGTSTRKDLRLGTRFITKENAESFATLANTSSLESFNAFAWRILHKNRFFKSRAMFRGRVMYLVMLWNCRRIQESKKLRRLLPRVFRRPRFLRLFVLRI